MILVGRHLSPFVRRVAISLRLLGIAYEHRPLATTTERDAIRAYNPLVRVPALVLDDGETLIDSTPILDYLDELVGPERALVPPKGPERRAALRLVAFGVGVAEKTVSAYYERDRRPPEKTYGAWVEQCEEQVLAGLDALDAAAAAGREWLAGPRIGQADVTAVAAFEFTGRVLPHLDPVRRAPRLAALAERCNALPAFAETRP